MVVNTAANTEICPNTSLTNVRTCAEQHAESFVPKEKRLETEMKMMFKKLETKNQMCKKKKDCVAPWVTIPFSVEVK
jgi:hypothetical protein